MGALALVVLLLAAAGAWAGPEEHGLAAPLAPAGVVSDTISYQGRLLDSSGNPVDGTRTMTFRLYTDASGGTPLWSQSGSVTVDDGLFNVNLNVDAAHFDGRALWLGVQVQGDAQEMTPRQPLLPAPYALSLRPVTLISGTASSPIVGVCNSGSSHALWGGNNSTYAAIFGENEGAGPGVSGVSISGVGVSGQGASAGVEGQSTDGFGLLGSSVNDAAVLGSSVNGAGGLFTSTLGYGVVVDGAGLDGLRIFNRVGGDYIKAGSGADPDFRVYDDGEVRSDVGFNTPANDFAEMMVVEDDPTGYEPGDVLVVSDARNRAVGLASSPYARAVIGVYSTAPGFVGGRPVSGDDPSGSVPVAILGIVPCKVSAENGPIRRGDLLVASSTPGHAMRADDPPPGTILGKALEPLDADTGLVLVLVTLQ